ncbi:MAG: hypothetical protein JO340_11915 [Acidobacteriaceae bacterium]|nr:hypothetical protein [Acidobacteriaceae bacterium]
MQILLRTAVVGALAAGCALADITFDQTVKFTGGSMVEMMRRMANNPLLGRKGGALGAAFQDQNYTVYIKGSKMARIGPVMSSVIDLNAGTITTINNQRRTYATQTFDEMRARMQEAQQRMNHGQAVSDLQFDVKVDKTGQTRAIDGKDATETVLTLTAKSAGANGQMVVKVDSWLVAPDAAMQEAGDFYKKLSQQFSYAFAGAPGLGAAGSGIAAGYREMMKLDGYPLLSDISISGVTTPMGPMGGGDPNAPMLITETQASHFVTGPIDDSKFAIPAGYTEEQGRPGPRPQ